MSSLARRSAGGLVVLAMAVGAGTLAPGAAAATTLPSVTVSPLHGTPDASPSTQISFLGVPASHLHGIVVDGSSSGVHSGRIGYYSTHTGGSFLPTHPFTPGEHVTVSATVVGYGAPIKVATTFDVSDPFVLPAG